MTVRAVVADDSHFMRSVIADILSEGGIEVVERARDGREAVDAVAEHEPDVATMDVEMPGMNGIEAVERIMADTPTPVVMLSAHTDENAEVTFEALDKGAVDFFTKPGGEVSMEMSRLKDQLVDIVTSVAGADVSGSGRGASTSDGTASAGSAASAAGSGAPAAGDDSGGRAAATADAPGSGAAATGEYLADPTLVVGSSTGGPKTVERLLAELPRAADLRVLVVQHMPEGFTARFAGRVDARSDYDVREAEDGDRIRGGEALIAAGDRHMRVDAYRRGRLRVSLTDEAPVNSVRPAVDVTMETAAAEVDDPLVGVILTGMGEDGADGVRAIAGAGGHTLAQDEATSAVYGMPKRAVETGCVDDVLPIGDLAGGVVAAITR